MERDNFLQVNWEQPAFLATIKPYGGKNLEAYHGVYNIGLGEDLTRKYLILVIHEAKNSRGRYIDGEIRSLNKARMYEEFRNLPGVLQFVRRVYLDEKPKDNPHRNERWALMFDDADTSIRDYLNQRYPRKKSQEVAKESSSTSQVAAKAKESSFRISIVRGIFVALSELHYVGYLICRATPDHFLIRIMKNNTLRICIADINELIKKVETTNENAQRQKEFTDDFKKLIFVVIFILSGEWMETTTGCEKLVSNLALSFITSVQEGKFKTIDSLLIHPLFWDAPKLVTFYCTTSDFLKDIVGQPIWETLEPAFENVGFEVFGNSNSTEYDWKKAVDPTNEIVSTMQKMSQTKKWYNTKNVIDLIRLIRNAHHHPTEQLKDLCTDECIANYIEKQCPKLTTSVYGLMFERCSHYSRFKRLFFNA